MARLWLKAREPECWMPTALERHYQTLLPGEWYCLGGGVVKPARPKWRKRAQGEYELQLSKAEVRLVEAPVNGADAMSSGSTIAVPAARREAPVPAAAGDGHAKRQLIEYLRRAAAHELLTRCNVVMGPRGICNPSPRLSSRRSTETPSTARSSAVDLEVLLRCPLPVAKLVA